jgi:membrane protein DedA with SNARE-associated domain
VIGHLLEDLGEWTRAVMDAFGYPGLIFIMILENVFPPIPSEIVLPLAGFLSQGNDAIFSLPLVVLAGGLGSVVGALILYGFGAWARTHGGRRAVMAVGRYAFLTDDDLDRAEEWFARYRGWAVFICRFVPLVRSLISIPAGYNAMPLGQFIALSAVGTTIWCAILAIAGWLLGASWPMVRTVLSRYEQVILVLCVLAVVAFLGWRLRARLGTRAG